MNEFDQLVEFLKKYLGDLKCIKRKKIDLSGGDFSNDGQVFQLYVGTEGNVNYITEGGTAGIEKFVVGYHPCNFKKILQASTTASDLAACFN